VYILAEKKLVIPSKHYKGDTSVVSARLPNDMIKDLDKIAESTGRNRNEIIMLCLEYAIENLDSDGKED
jgi:predicted DNA-binding protein